MSVRALQRAQAFLRKAGDEVPKNAYPSRKKVWFLHSCFNYRFDRTGKAYAL